MLEVDKAVEQNLFSAVKEGNLEKVKLITNCLEPTSLKSWDAGFDLLCIALQRKHTEIAKFLIELDLRIRCPLDKRNTALHVAVIYGDLIIIDMLVQRGISIYTEDSQMMPPFLLIAKRTSVNLECERIIKYFFFNHKVSVFAKHTESRHSLLHFAVEFGNEKLIPVLLKYHFQINTRGSNGQTPLHLAIIKSQPRIVSLLLQHGASRDATDSNGLCPLRLAIMKGNSLIIKIVFRCIRQRKSIDYQTRYGALLLYAAVVLRHNQTIRSILKKKPDVKSHLEETGKTPLHVAVENGSVPIAKLLLQLGANPNASQHPVKFPAYSSDTCLERLTPLEIAIRNNDAELCQLLTTHSFYNERECKKGLSVLTSSGYESFFDSMSDSYKNVKGNDWSSTKIKFIDSSDQFLVEKDKEEIEVRNFDIPAGSLWLYKEKETINCLQVPVLSEVKLMIEKLLKEHGDSSKIEHSDQLCAMLYLSSYFGFEKFVEFLMRKGFDPNSCVNHFLPSLHAAADQGWNDIVKLLLKYGAEINPNSKIEEAVRYFSTPLLVATYKGNEEIVDTLLNHGADINARLGCVPLRFDDEKYDPVFIRGSYSLCDIVPSGQKLGFTALHMAVELNNKSIVDNLLRHGADVNIKSVKNTTPLSLALASENQDIIRSLLQTSFTDQVLVTSKKDISDDNNNEPE